MVLGRKSTERVEGVRSVLTVSGLNKSMKERAYPESLRRKYEVLRGAEVESVENEWENFRDIVKGCTNEVCGMRCVGWQKRKASEWWSEEVCLAVAEKHEELLKNGCREQIGIHMTGTGHRELL